MKEKKIEWKDKDLTFRNRRKEKVLHVGIKV